MDRKSSVTIDLLRLGVMDTDAASANHHRIAENIGAAPNRLADWEQSIGVGPYVLRDSVMVG